MKYVRNILKISILMTGIVVMAIAIITMTGCEDISSNKEVVGIPQTPSRELTQPKFPALAMHIVYREFISRHPEIKTLNELDEQFPSYLEDRLIELYPEDAYIGMVEEGKSELEALKADYEKYSSDLEQYNKSIPINLFKTVDDSTGDDEEWPEDYNDEMGSNMDYIPTLEQETDSLQMVDEEIQLWLDIENFVNDTTGGLAKKADIDRFILAKTNSWLTPALIACGVATYVYWRVNLCADRAYSRERSYFDGDNTYDTRGDAFRHTFVSMQLRRYLTQFMSWLIMDGREWWFLDDNYAAYEMDLHNNYLGRTEKYSHFRAHWFWDIYDWEKWGRRVRDYIKNQNNREYIQEWDSYNEATRQHDKPDYVAPTESQAKDRSDNVSSWKFIYFDSQPTGNAGLEN
ncbi:MAG: hypothetical protein WC703_08630 [Candidatus Neomarinimicrobiota bacterium]